MNFFEKDRIEKKRKWHNSKINERNPTQATVTMAADCLIDVFHFLQARDVERCFKVCRRWKAIIAEGCHRALLPLNKNICYCLNWSATSEKEWPSFVRLDSEPRARRASCFAECVSSNQEFVERMCAKLIPQNAETYLHEIMIFSGREPYTPFSIEEYYQNSRVIRVEEASNVKRNVYHYTRELIEHVVHLLEHVTARSRFQQRQYLSTITSFLCYVPTDEPLIREWFLAAVGFPLNVDTLTLKSFGGDEPLSLLHTSGTTANSVSVQTNDRSLMLEAIMQLYDSYRSCHHLVLNTRTFTHVTFCELVDYLIQELRFASSLRGMVYDIDIRSSFYNSSPTLINSFDGQTAYPQLIGCRATHISREGMRFPEDFEVRYEFSNKGCGVDLDVHIRMCSVTLSDGSLQDLYVNEKRSVAENMDVIRHCRIRGAYVLKCY